MMRRLWMSTMRATMLMLGIAPTPGMGASEGVNVELIIDSSGSMAAKLEGRQKMAIAKEVLTWLVGTIPQDARVAIRTYGHRRKEDCQDLELLTPVGPKNPAQVSRQIQALKPMRCYHPSTAGSPRASIPLTCRRPKP